MAFICSNTLSIGEKEFLTKNSDMIVDRLDSVSKAVGLRNSDIATLTGWQASKISKLKKKSQKLSEEDLKTWAKSLGYSPNVFLREGFEIRDFSLSEHVRGIRAILLEFCEHKGDYEDQECLLDTIHYELPLSVINILGLTPTDYVSRGRLNHSSDIFRGMQSPLDHGIKVWLFHRNVRIDDVNLYFEYIISPDRSSAVLGIFKTIIGSGNPDPSRMRDKDLILIDNDDTKSWDMYYRRNKEWLPHGYKDAEIFSIIYDLENIPDEEQLENDLHLIYDKYCNLVSEKKDGLNIRARNDLPTRIDAYGSFWTDIGSDISTQKRVKETNHYKCEMNPDHTSFEDDTGNPYMKVISLIPFRNAGEYKDKILCDANKLCLCPLCAEQYGRGKKADREQMVFTLFRKHEKALKESGIDISLAQALTMNGLD